MHTKPAIKCDSADNIIRWCLRHYLPQSGYRLLATTYQARQKRKQLSEWRAHQIAVVLRAAEPHLPPLEEEYFYSSLRCCNTYIEYGSGGSTLAALNVVSRVVSVENDRAFYRAVTKEARSLSNPCYFPIFVYTGRINDWGEPAVRKRTPLRRWLWRQYAVAPWKVIEKYEFSPDLIFIDGRFRVACALESLLRLPRDSSCRILLDDIDQYDGAYFPVFDFAERVEQCGRLVRLAHRSNFDRDRCQAALSRYYEDFR